MYKAIKEDNIKKLSTNVCFNYLWNNKRAFLGQL